MRGFNVVWNSPTFQCKSTGINFEQLLRKYGIVVNDKDTFRGDIVSILYDPGNFPALLENKSDSQIYVRNGGVPQEGSTDVHLQYLKEQIDMLIPDEKFSGIGVVDFESWRPVFRQNFGKLTPYKEYSYDIERGNHPFWPESWIKKEASKRFEKSGRLYVEETIDFLKRMRPDARWGYYAYPYCFNMRASDKKANCADEVIAENDKIQWMWDKSDIFFPSVYMSKKHFNEEERLQMVKGRINEAMRISSQTEAAPEIYPYVWYKYQDDTNEFVSKEDIENTIRYMKEAGLPGLIMWGSSGDVNNQEKCHKLKNYIENTLGPLVKKYRTIGQQKEQDLDHDVSNKTEDEYILNDTSRRFIVNGKESDIEKEKKKGKKENKEFNHNEVLKPKQEEKLATSLKGSVDIINPKQEDISDVTDVVANKTSEVTYGDNKTVDEKVISDANITKIDENNQDAVSNGAVINLKQSNKNDNGQENTTNGQWPQEAIFDEQTRTNYELLDLEPKEEILVNVEINYKNATDETINRTVKDEGINSSEEINNQENHNYTNSPENDNFDGKKEANKLDQLLDVELETNSEKGANDNLTQLQENVESNHEVDEVKNNTKIATNDNNSREIIGSKNEENSTGKIIPNYEILSFKEENDSYEEEIIFNSGDSQSKDEENNLGKTRNIFVGEIDVLSNEQEEKNNKTESAPSDNRTNTEVIEANSDEMIPKTTEGRHGKSYTIVQNLTYLILVDNQTVASGRRVMKDEIEIVLLPNISASSSTS